MPSAIPAQPSPHLINPVIADQHLPMPPGSTALPCQPWPHGSCEQLTIVSGPPPEEFSIGLRSQAQYAHAVEGQQVDLPQSSTMLKSTDLGAATPDIGQNETLHALEGPHAHTVEGQQVDLPQSSTMLKSTDLAAATPDIGQNETSLSSASDAYVDITNIIVCPKCHLKEADKHTMRTHWLKMHKTKLGRWKSFYKRLRRINRTKHTPVMSPSLLQQSSTATTSTDITTR